MSATRTPLFPAPAASANWQRFSRTEDVDELASSMQGWTFEYDQLSKGPFVGTVHHVQLPGLRLVHEYASCAVRQRGQIGEGFHGLGIAVDAVAHATYNGQPLGKDCLMTGVLDTVDICTAPGFAHVAIIVDTPLLASALDAMYGARAPAIHAAQLAVDVAPDVAARVRAAHLDAMRQVMERPQILEDEALAQRMRDDILHDWIGALPFAYDADYLGSASSRKRLVDRACALMMDRFDVSVLELCDALNTGRRKLEYSFKETLGMSPVKYQRVVRLNRARRDLKDGSARSDSVYDVAARWGFWHHGEFSASYTQLFGELPSATQRAAREVRAA